MHTTESPTTTLITVAAFAFAAMALAPRAYADGRIKGSAGGNERGSQVFAAQGELVAWTVTGPSGLYEFGGIPAGEYIMEVAGRIVPGVRVDDDRTTIVDYARQPGLSFEQELWGPSRVRFAQSFVATGTAVTSFSLWRASGNSRLRVSLYEDSPSGRRVAGPYETPESLTWICAADLPAEQFRTEPGRRYAIELDASDGKPWACSMPRIGDVYPDGIAYFDGVPHAESDLGIAINEQRPGLIVIAAAREDLHFIKEGPGSGTCRTAGQTFVATTPNVLTAYSNCGFNGPPADFVYSVHEDGPGGRQIGPAGRTRMVSNWGSTVVWFPDAIPLTIGQRYYLEYRRADGEPFFSYLSAPVYEEGEAYRDGKAMPNFDQLFKIVGEAEPGGITYPYDVRITDVTADTVTVTWHTGTPADGQVHYGTTDHLNDTAGSTEERTTEHAVTVRGLKPGTAYSLQASSHTHKRSTTRTYSRVYDVLTLPAGPDRPRFVEPPATQPAEPCANCVPLKDGGFEDGVDGWTRYATTGHPDQKDRFKANIPPFGRVTRTASGYRPHSGVGMYGWSHIGPDDPNQEIPREDWNQEVIYQRVAVEPGRRYVLTAWILTGDRGSGWGRDSRLRIGVDEKDTDAVTRPDTFDKANVTQWFATQNVWRRVRLEFRPAGDHVTIGAHLLQWWTLEANHLYIDEFSVQPVE